MKIKIYLLDGLDLIIGIDEKDKIKKACRLFCSPQGIVIVHLYQGSSFDLEKEINLDKKDLVILDTSDPSEILLTTFKNYIEGIRDGNRKIISPNMN